MFGWLKKSRKAEQVPNTVTLFNWVAQQTTDPLWTESKPNLRIHFNDWNRPRPLTKRELRALRKKQRKFGQKLWD